MGAGPAAFAGWADSPPGAVLVLGVEWLVAEDLKGHSRFVISVWTSYDGLIFPEPISPSEVPSRWREGQEKEKCWAQGVPKEAGPSESPFH